MTDAPPEALYSVDAAASSEDSIPAADSVIIKGKPDNIEAAYAALLALIPETETVEVAADLHGGIIGPKGETVRKLMLDNDVNVKVPGQSAGTNAITLKGLRANIEKAKEAIAKLVVQLEADKAVSSTDHWSSVPSSPSGSCSPQLQG